VRVRRHKSGTLAPTFKLGRYCALTCDTASSVVQIFPIARRDFPFHISSSRDLTENAAFHVVARFVLLILKVSQEHNMLMTIAGLAWGMLTAYFVVLVRLGGRSAPKPADGLRPRDIAASEQSRHKELWAVYKLIPRDTQVLHMQ
jgi:hypothetical protein